MIKTTVPMFGYAPIVGDSYTDFIYNEFKYLESNSILIVTASTNII